MGRKVFTAGEILTAADMNELSALTVPAGAVQAFAMSSVPDGFLKANGATVSRETFADLFAAIGTTFGAGDGSTTFDLPDMRGEFPRGFDDGRGVDSGRAFGSDQLDQMQKITGVFDIGRGNNGARASQGSGSGVFTHNTVNVGNLFQSIGASIVATASHSFDSANSPNARVSSATTGETRARNIALLYCIKF